MYYENVAFKPNCYAFRLRDFKTALTLSYNENKDKSVIWHILTSFSIIVKRRVKIDAASPKVIGQRRFLAECLQKGILHRIPTPVEFVPSYGLAEFNNRKITVNIWPFANMNHPGHSSCSIEDVSESSYFSFWPCEVADNKKLNAIIPMEAELIPSITEDMKKEISDGVRKKLEHYSTIEAKLNFSQKITPRSNQVRVDGTWGVMPEKLHLPLIGYSNFEDSCKNSGQFAFFGLNSAAMKKERVRIQAGVKNREIKYRMITPTANCSGMLKRVLEAGGIRRYAKLDNKLYITPNDIHFAVTKAINRIDELNVMVRALYLSFSENIKQIDREKNEKFVGQLESIFAREISQENFLDFINSSLLRFVRTKPHMYTEIFSAIRDVNECEDDLDALTNKLE